MCVLHVPGDGVSREKREGDGGVRRKEEGIGSSGDVAWSEGRREESVGGSHG